MRIRPVILCVLVAAVMLLIAVSASSSPQLAVALALIGLAAALTLRFHGVPIVIVLAAAYATVRVGPASANLSVADAVLFVGALAALPFTSWESQRLRRVLVGFMGYEACLALAVLAHPTSRSIVEWGHRILLVVEIGRASCRERV